MSSNRPSVARNRNQRVSLEGCELQLKPSLTNPMQPNEHLARMKIRHPPKVYLRRVEDLQQDEAEAVARELKYKSAPHLKYLTCEEVLDRQRIMANRSIDYRELSLTLAWPMLANGSVHSDLYRRSVAMATLEDTRARLSEQEADNDAAELDLKPADYRRRKDPVLLHEEKVFNQDRMLRSLDK